MPRGLPVPTPTISKVRKLLATNDRLVVIAGEVELSYETVLRILKGVGRYATANRRRPMGRPRVPDAKVAKVRQLLTRRLSQRKIAKQARVSRGAVGRIATGKGAYAAKPAKPRQPEVVSFLDAPKAESVWCGPCGSKVRHPCLACRARTFMKTKPGLAQ